MGLGFLFPSETDMHNHNGFLDTPFHDLMIPTLCSPLNAEARPSTNHKNDYKLTRRFFPGVIINREGR